MSKQNQKFSETNKDQATTKEFVGNKECDLQYEKKPQKSGGRRRNSNNKRNTTTDNKTNHRSKAKIEYPGFDNDVSWYKGSSLHSVIVTNSANAVNFETIAGRPLNVNKVDPTVCAPSICALRMVTGPGISASDPMHPSAITLASRKTWATMRTVLTNASHYQPADVAMLICAMDEVLSLAVHVHRMFKLINTYKVNNLYFPDEFLTALYDFSANDIQYLRDNKLNLIATYNQACIACAPLIIPSEYGFIRRHTFLYANIFADGKTAKSQFFGMKPYGYREWSDLGDQGSELKFHFIYEGKPENMSKPQWLINRLWFLINAITGSESALEILADVWKVFGKGSAFAPMPASEFDVMDISFDNYDVLGQINNAYCLGFGIKDITERHVYDIKQSVATNSIVFNPGVFIDSPETNKELIQQLEMISKNSSNNNRVLINAHLTDPNPDDVIELTRMMPVVEENLKSEFPQYYVSSMGCDFVDSFELHGLKGVGSSHLLFAYNYVLGSDRDVMTKISALAAFDWHPPMFIAEDVTSVENGKLLPLIDIDNYATVDGEQLDVLNNNIQMAMWNVGDLSI